MKHYYCDKSRPTRKWETMLTSPNRVLFGGDKFRSADAKLLDISDGLIFVHRSYFNERSLGNLPALLSRHQKLIVVVISGEEQTTPDGMFHVRLYFRKAPVSVPEDPAFEDCVKRFSADLFTGGVANPEFSLLEPDGSASLALWLLCESWNFTGGESAKETADGITVRAPTCAPDWFRPFGTEHPTDADAGRVAAFLAHDTQAAGKAFLQALVSRNGKVTETDVRGMIEELRGKKRGA